MVHTLEEKKFGLSGSTLKMIALITMVIDHIGAAVIEMGVLDIGNSDHFQQLLTTDYGRQWQTIDLMMRLVGRISFPIFCFLLVEGFFHTRDRRKYAMNMLIFALISEIPFDLAIFGKVINLEYQNIFFSLFIGIIVLMGMERVSSSYLKQMCVAACGCMAAYIFKTDYQEWGIILIMCFYLFYGNKKKQLVAGGLAAAMESAGFLGAAAISILPIWCYNGERGKIRSKYLFYVFYPAHLLILYFIRLLILKEL